MNQADPTGQRERAKAERRERILNAARTLICEGGTEALSAQAIAVQAQVSVATLYNLIGPLEAVHKALLEQLAGDFASALQNHLQTEQISEDPYASLLSFADATYAFLSEDIAAYQALHRVIFESQFSPTGSTLSLRARQHGARHLRACLRSLQAQQRLRGDADLPLLVEQLLMFQVILLQNWSIDLIDLERLRAMLKLQILQLLHPWATRKASAELEQRIHHSQSQVQQHDKRQQPAVAKLLNTGKHS
jgi:AcrR family transcriptional regulator